MRPFPLLGAALTVLFLAFWPTVGQTQCIMVCDTGIVEISLDNTCIRTVQSADLLVSAMNCDPFAFSIEIEDGNGDPVPFNLLTSSHLYDTLFATVTYNGNPVQSCQVTIRVVDKITCPPAQVFIAPVNTCSVTETLPPLDVSDSCNPIINVQISASFGTGQGPHNIPVGMHIVTYTAFTAQNDSVKCTMNVSVANSSPPSVTCQDLSPGLQPSGTVTLPALSLIASENDTCGIILREVRRINPGPTAYGPTVSFDCDDVGISVLVRVRVTNASGLTDSCEAMVLVVDKTPPLVLECPKDTIVDCNVYNGQPDSFGMATFFDVCGPAPDTVHNEDLRDKCGVGQIIRTFTALDLDGNSASCVQVLTIVNNTPLTDSLITWPEDYVLEACISPPSMHPDSLPPPHNRPVVDGSVCSIIAIGYQDETLIVTNPGCFKILRTWTVVDCCIYDPQDLNPVGIFTHVQMIKVIDNDPPVLNCPATFPVSVGPNCTVIFANLPDITADDCNPKVKITNNSPFSINKGPNASGNYPLGTTTVMFTAADMCGNFSHCKVDVVVSDFAPPTPQCLHGLSTDLGFCDGEVVVKIMASFFNQHSYDNCTPKGNLTYSFSSDTSFQSIMFDCTHQNDTIPIEMWVTDQVGNQAYCVTYIIVQDNFDLCPGNKTFTLEGEVQSAQGENMEGAEVHLSGKLNKSVVTDQNGAYAFKDLEEGPYTIEVSKSNDPIKGVSTYDLLLIQKHLLGVKSIDDPYKLIAADANLTGSISIADIIQLRKWILSPQIDVAPYKGWRFLNAAQPMNAQDPLDVQHLEMIQMNPLNVDQPNVSFVAVKVGDISGDAFGIGGNEAETRGDQNPLILRATSPVFAAGDMVECVIRLSDEEALQSIQFALDWDADVIQFEGVQSLASTLNMNNAHFGIHQSEQGVLRVSWNDANGAQLIGEEQLFRIRFKALQAGRLSELLNVNASMMQPEAILGDGQQERQADIQLKWEQDTEAEKTSFALYQNKPNPFRDLTMIGFRIPDAAEVILTLFTPGGQVITEFRGRYPAGYHEMSVPGELLPPNGIIFYKLEAPGFSETKRMVRQ